MSRSGTEWYGLAWLGEAGMADYEWSDTRGWVYVADRHPEIPSTLQCICSVDSDGVTRRDVVVRVFLDGRRYDARTGDEHVHVLPEATPVPQTPAPARTRPPAQPESRYEGELA